MYFYQMYIQQEKHRIIQKISELLWHNGSKKELSCNLFELKGIVIVVYRDKFDPEMEIVSL